ncbi:hypothetical protein ACQ86G_19285 [Roseateles chitinivorans]|uniref:hypothetical protein n=1 Tax=Roseateles chitinivorans TaxID=2917965 RepID=UPI003D66CDAF
MNPLPFRPATPLEHRLCDLVESASGEVVLHVWTQETYPFFDENDEPMKLAADFAVRTGQLHNGLFVGGSMYLAHVCGDDVRVEFTGAYR